jgi:hypothetical protein
LARNALQIGSDDGNALALAPWTIGDPTDPMAVADARNAVAGVDALGAWLAAQRAKTAQRSPQIWPDGNAIGTETTRPTQWMSNVDPSFRPGVFVGGGTVPMSQEQIDAFRRGSEDVYEQASLLAGVAPVTGGARAVSLGARRPLANPPPSRAPEPVVEQPSFDAYHGSPHLFAPTARNPLGEFDPAKIGTGEGAQAYGVGAGYLAGNEGVARGYRDKLAPGSQLAVNGVPVSGMPDSVRGIAQWMERTGKSPEDLIPITQQRIVKAREDAKSLGLDPGALVDEHQATLDAIERLRGAQVSRIPSGHMYEVKVNADPERFLHWDKPLSEQSQYVRDALNNLPANVRDNLVGVLRGALDNPGGLASKRFATGEQIYKDLSDAHSRMSGDPTLYETPQGKIVAASARGAADALQQAGIPGIRYLDQGSRGAGEGSHNYVVFDANTMNIIRRYGLAGLMAAGGAAATQQQQPNALQAQ